MPAKFLSAKSIERLKSIQKIADIDQVRRIKRFNLSPENFEFLVSNCFEPGSPLVNVHRVSESEVRISGVVFYRS